jgi:hypothetical protein
VNIAANEGLGPQLRLATFNEITSLLLEHHVVIGDSNKLIVAESLTDPTSPFQEYFNFEQIGHAGQEGGVDVARIRILIIFNFISRRKGNMSTEGSRRIYQNHDTQPHLTISNRTGYPVLQVI